MARFDNITCPPMLELNELPSDSFQIGGGINENNANFWIDAGASKVELNISISAIEFINPSVLYR